jgi:hypothetical protein
MNHLTTRILLLAALTVAGLALLAPRPGAAQSAATIRDGGAKVDFPNAITFSAQVSAPDRVQRVVLEYGVEKRTCGTVIAEAFPDLKPGPSASVTWTWDMRKSGAEPPGSTVWYRWHAWDASGAEQISERKTVAWLDSVHTWRNVSGGGLTLHWYQGSQTFAQDLLDSAVGSLGTLGKTTGLTSREQINLYIYADNKDMQDALLYEPGWTGGQAFPESNILVIGLSQQQEAWGTRTEAHELTHMLVGQLAYSCLSVIPTWLNEGIAVYGEGGPEQASRTQLEQAIRADTLISTRALSGGFSEHPSAADLSYAESYSLVNYLVTQGGSGKLVQLFGDLRDGQDIETALQHTYSFGLDGLEDRWRASVGAKPRRAAGMVATATVEPSPIPTYPPISAAPVAPGDLSPGPSPSGGGETATAVASPSPAADSTGSAPTAEAATPTPDPQATVRTPEAENDIGLMWIAGGALLLAALLVGGILLARRAH